MLHIFVFLVLIAIIAPALVIVPQSFTSLNYFVYPIKEFSLKWYQKFFENPEWITSLERSLLIAVLFSRPSSARLPRSRSTSSTSRERACSSTSCSPR